jgi:hypothetical protein
VKYHLSATAQRLIASENALQRDVLKIEPALEQLQRSNDHLRKIALVAEAKNDFDTAISAHREVRKGIELLARIRGEMTLAPMIETNGGPVKIQIVRVEPTEHRLPQPNGQVIALPALADKPN